MLQSHVQGTRDFSVCSLPGTRPLVASSRDWNLVPTGIWYSKLGECLV